LEVTIKVSRYCEDSREKRDLAKLFTLIAISIFRLPRDSGVDDDPRVSSRILDLSRGNIVSLLARRIAKTVLKARSANSGALLLAKDRVSISGCILPLLTMNLWENENISLTVNTKGKPISKVNSDSRTIPNPRNTLLSRSPRFNIGSSREPNVATLASAILSSRTNLAKKTLLAKSDSGTLSREKHKQHFSGENN